MNEPHKKCSKCSETLPESSFYTQKNAFDGLSSKCKKCTRLDMKQYRRNMKYREGILSRDRARGSRQDKKYLREYRKSNEAKYVAQNAINNAIRDGVIKRPERCQLCGEKCRTHGHHYDYSRPLSVIWLCPSCHKMTHALEDLISAAKSENDCITSGENEEAA